MKTVSLKDGLLHVETPLGVINIRAGLVDSTGRRVDSITVTPEQCAGQKKIIRRGYYNTRMIELKGVRV